MAFSAISLVGADNASNEVDFSAWTKLLELYNAYVGQTPAANKIALYSSATALAFIDFTAKAAAIAACANNAAVLAELGITTQGRNVLPNGDFRVAQRGVGPFTSASTFVNNDDAYLVDGCVWLAAAADVADLSVSTTVTPAGSVGGYSSFVIDVETANNKFGIFLPVEARDAKRLIDGNAVLSFQARRGSNATVLTMRAAIVSWQGTEDTITSDIVSAWGASGTNPTLAANWTYETTPQDLTLTTSFQKFGEANGLAGAIDTASTKNVGVFIWYNKTDATVADFVYITDVQLEKGLVATDYEHRSYEAALEHCRRFLLPCFAPGSSPIAQKAGTALIALPLKYKPMRGAPALIHSSPTWAGALPSGNQVSYYEFSSASYPAITGALTPSVAFTTVTETELRLTAGTSFGGTSGSVGFLYTGASALMFLSAEL